MKRFIKDFRRIAHILIAVSCVLFAGGTAAATPHSPAYDAFGAEDNFRPDHNRIEQDVFIETTHYIRMGLLVNIDGGLTREYLRHGGERANHDFGLGPTFAIGREFGSMLRAELGFERSDFRFDDYRAHKDAAHLTLILDLWPRYSRREDMVVRRSIVPFVGVGAIGGHGNFREDDGMSGWLYGLRGVAGLGLAFTETNAIDLTVFYNQMRGRGYYWNQAAAPFSGIGASITWRSHF